MMSAGGSVPHILLGFGVANCLAVSVDQLVMTVFLNILGGDHWDVLHQLFGCFPRPILLIVMSLPLDEHVHFFIGINEALYVILGAQLDRLGDL